MCGVRKQHRTESPIHRKSQRDGMLILQQSLEDFALRAKRYPKKQRNLSKPGDRRQLSTPGIRRDELVRDRQQEISLEWGAGESCIDDKEQSGYEHLWGRRICWWVDWWWGAAERTGEWKWLIRWEWLVTGQAERSRWPAMPSWHIWLHLIFSHFI